MLVVEDARAGADRTGAGQTPRRLVACCHLRDLGGGTAALGMVAVRPDRQGAGVGRALLTAAEAEAAGAWGASRVELTVLVQRTEVIAWYARRGYAPTGERRPFPYGDARFGRPRREDLAFVVLARRLPGGPGP